MADQQENTEQTPEPEPKNIEEKAEPKTQPSGHSHLTRFRAWYSSHKKWSIPGTVIILLLILAAVPWTRYKIAGLAIKKDVSIYVTDSKSGTAVSSAAVELDGKQAETSGQGYALFHHVPTGSYKVTVIKKYYLDASRSVTVGFSRFEAFQVNAVATGRQVKIGVKDLISQNALGGVVIKIADISAKTDQTGTATVVLPVGPTSEKGTLSLNGYNDSDVTVKISDSQVQDNEYNLTPAGNVYFLSKLSGKIDVVKTNLDGTDRQTVLAGTGNEDDQGTVLLASRDWKYLALLSRRAGNYASLYLIDTTNNDSLSTIDEGAASFTPVGWSNDNFVYTVSRDTVQFWQPHHQALKSYDTQTKQLLTLDQTNAQGTSPYNYVSEIYSSTNIAGNAVLFTKYWDFGYSYLDPSAPTINDKSAGIYSINSDGSNSQTLKAFPYNVNNDGANGNYGVNIYLSSLQAGPSSVYYQETLNIFSQSTVNYYAYSNGKVTQNSSIETDYNNYVNSGYPTYLLSPSGAQTFWGEPRDGKNTLFIGDKDAGSGKQVATLSDYNPYGWYTDDYLLVSKDSSELYAMSKDGKNVIKISDYHKPAQTFNGYGGGYGGI